MKKSIRILVMGISALTWCVAASAQPPAEKTISVNIRAQAMSDALNELAAQTGLQLLFHVENVMPAELTAPAVVGALTPRAALKKLLANSGLAYNFVNERTVEIRPAASGGSRASSIGSVLHDRAGGAGRVRLTQVTADAASGSDARDETTKDAQGEGMDIAVDARGIPEILVRDRRTSNVDIRRTEDDVQPYVVLDAEDIKRAHSPNLEDFLRRRLPMNQSYESHSQDTGNVDGARSTVDLRGLGADQTLILVNGRRMPSVPGIGQLYQADINGIPMSAVERIEILPSTAGGIYGGGATGGVVNVILKRDYSGMEIAAGFDGTFAGGGSQRRLEVSGGFNLFGGRTEVLLMGSYHDSQPLTFGDRDFIPARSKQLVMDNAPDAFATYYDLPYGSQTNIRSVSRNELVLVESGQPLGANHASVPAGYAGPASDDGAAFLDTAGQFNLELPNDYRGRKFALLSAAEGRSLSVNVNHRFTDRITGFLEASRFDNRAATYWNTTGTYTLAVGPANPFTEAVTVSFPYPDVSTGLSRHPSKSLTGQIGGGLIVRLAHNWTAQAEYRMNESQSLAQFNTASAFLPRATVQGALNDGSLNALRDVNLYPLDIVSLIAAQDVPFGAVNDLRGETSNATLRFAGPVWTLPAGPVMLATLVERRKEDTADSVQANFTLATPRFTYRPPVGVTTRSAYAEITAPIISAGNARPAVAGFDVQLSYRHDKTSSRTHPVFTSILVDSPNGPFPEVSFLTNEVTASQYNLGFRYRPVESLAFRASYGEGILPPSVNELSPSERSGAVPSFYGYTDPKRGNSLITFVDRWLSSGSLDLTAELSKSWSAGVIFTPRSLSGLRVSIDYTRIRKQDEIASVDAQTILNQEEAFPGRIVRGPLTPEDEMLGFEAGPILEMNFGRVNIAHSLLEAFDVQADYTWETAYGAFRARLIGTYQPHLIQQVLEDTPEYERVGYSRGPLKLRGNAELSWERGGWMLGWNMQYYDSYQVYESDASDASRAQRMLWQGSASIPSQTYHDLFGGYRFSQGTGGLPGWLADTELLFAVQNVLDTVPPIIAQVVNSGSYSRHGDPRLRRYSISFRRRF